MRTVQEMTWNRITRQVDLQCTMILGLWNYLLWRLIFQLQPPKPCWKTKQMTLDKMAGIVRYVFLLIKKERKKTCVHVLIWWQKQAAAPSRAPRAKQSKSPKTKKKKTPSSPNKTVKKPTAQDKTTKKERGITPEVGLKNSVMGCRVLHLMYRV